MSSAEVTSVPIKLLASVGGEVFLVLVFRIYLLPIRVEFIVGGQQ